MLYRAGQGFVIKQFTFLLSMQGEDFGFKVLHINQHDRQGF